MQCEKRHCSYFGVLLVANSIRCRRLHSGSDLTPSLRRLQCVTLAFLSMPTSACKYMFSSVSHGCFAILQYPAVRSNGCVSDCGRHPRVVTVEFRQRYFGWPPTLPSQPSSDQFSLLQLGRSLVFVARIILQTLSPVFTGFKHLSALSSSF